MSIPRPVLLCTRDDRATCIGMSGQHDLVGKTLRAAFTNPSVSTRRGVLNRNLLALLSAFFVGLVASLGAAISMGLSEAPSDDGSVTGRGSPPRRGAITGFTTRHALYLPIPVSESGCAVVACELLTIAFIRYRFMGGELASTIVQVIVGGGIVFAIGVGLGRIGAG